MSAVKLQLLTYYEDLATDIFTTLAGEHWAMLLHSPISNHPNCKFDIIVTNPVATITSIAEQTTVTICANAQKIITDSCPFKVIEIQQKNLLPILSNDDLKLVEQHDLPFTSGVLGYFGYDLGRSIEDLPSIAQNDLNIFDLAVGIYQNAIIINHKSKNAYIVGHNIDDKLAIIQKMNNSKIKQEKSNFKLTSNWQANMTASEYQDKFQAVQEHLLNGDSYQINLAQRFKANYQGDEWQAYLKVANANLAPFSAFIRLNDDTAILSFSPEQFLMLDRQIITTKPMKGTAARDPNPLIDQQNLHFLQHSQKDQTENLIIVDLLRNDIGKVAIPASVQVPSLFAIESFAAVHHLVSTITAKINSKYSPYDLLKACFPGGSITGAPKIRAMQIIDNLEPHRRSVYCGSIGYISQHQTMDTNIAIRTIIAHKNTLYTWGGGAIVVDSKWDAEYAETFAKLNKILPILQ